MLTNEEIHAYCERIEKSWQNVSDLNLGMLIMMIEDRCRLHRRDLFFMDNEELVKNFEKFLEWPSSHAQNKII